MIVKFVWFVGFICLPLFISGCDSSKDVSVGVCIFHEQCSDKGHVYITNNCSRVSHEAINDYIASRGWNKGFNTTSTGKCFYVESGGLTLNSLGCSMRELRVGGLLVAMSKLAKAIRSSIKVFAVTNSVTGKVIEGSLEEASLKRADFSLEVKSKCIGRDLEEIIRLLHYGECICSYSCVNREEKIECDSAVAAELIVEELNKCGMNMVVFFETLAVDKGIPLNSMKELKENIPPFNVVADLIASTLEKHNENMEYNCAIMHMPKSGRFQSKNIE